jgi:hypothetical protein
MSRRFAGVVPAGVVRAPLKQALREPQAPLVGSPPMETFMVRVWRPVAEERSEGVRGVAVHIGSGRRITFSEPRRLIRFLAEAGGLADGAAPDRDPPPASDQEQSP